MSKLTEIRDRLVTKLDAKSQTPEGLTLEDTRILVALLRLEAGLPAGEQDEVVLTEETKAEVLEALRATRR